MRRLFVFLTAVPLLAIAAAACGGDGSDEPLALEQYFERLEELDQRLEERTDNLESGLDDRISGAGSIDEAAQGFSGFYEEAAVVFFDFRDDLQELRPPAEAENPHGRAISGSRAVAEAFQALARQALDAESEVDLNVLEEDPAFGIARRALVDACVDLQQVADENGIDVTLNCGEE